MRSCTQLLDRILRSLINQTPAIVAWVVGDFFQNSSLRRGQGVRIRLAVAVNNIIAIAAIQYVVIIAAGERIVAATAYE